MELELLLLGVFLSPPIVKDVGRVCWVGLVVLSRLGLLEVDWSDVRICIWFSVLVLDLGVEREVLGRIWCGY